MSRGGVDRRAEERRGDDEKRKPFGPTDIAAMARSPSSRSTGSIGMRLDGMWAVRVGVWGVRGV